MKPQFHECLAGLLINLDGYSDHLILGTQLFFKVLIEKSFVTEFIFHARISNDSFPINSHLIRNIYEPFFRV